MIRIASIFRRALLRLALVGGLLSAMLLFAAKPMRAATPAQDQVSRDFQQSLTLGAGQSVRIEHKFGSVKLHGESGRDVKISATIRAQASSHEEAESFVQKIKIEVQQTGEGVRIKTIYPEEEKKWFHSSKHSSWSVSYDIAMPSDAPITVRNSFGSVEVSGVHGVADVENGYGTVAVRDAGAGRWNNAFGSIELTGAAGNVSVSDNNGSVQVTDVKGTLEVRNRFGGITTRNIQGAVTITGGNGAVTLSDAASANITTSFGNVDARNIRGDLLVRDNNGNVEISAIGGAANITDSFGNVTFSDVRGRVDCTTNNGRVKGTSVTGGSVTIRDSFGNIELDTISGALDAETSNGKISVRDARGSVTLKSSFGAIEASNVPKGIRAITGNGAISVTATRPASGCRDISLKTSFSSIRVRVPEGLGYNLTARTSFGRISSELPVTSTGSIGGDTLNGTIGTGGCQLQLTDSNGSIEIAKAP